MSYIFEPELNVILTKGQIKQSQARNISTQFL